MEKTKKRWNAITEKVSKEKEIIGAELGVWSGKLSEQLLIRLPKLKLILVDRWCVPPKGDSYFQGSKVMSRHPQGKFDRAFQDTIKKVTPFAERVRILKMTTVQAAEWVEDESLDFIFIDSDHSYKGVTTDLKHWVPKVKKGGLISGHDWGNDNTKQDVKNAVLDFFQLKQGWDSLIELSYNNTWFKVKI